MDQVHGARVVQVDRALVGPGPRGRRAGQHAPRVWPSRCWSPTACPCCSPTRTPVSSAWPMPGGRGWPPGSSPLRSPRCATWGRGGSSRGWGRRSAAAATRCRPRCAPRSRRSRRRRSRSTGTAARRSTSPQASWPSSDPSAAISTSCRLHPRESRALLLSPRRHHRPLRRRRRVTGAGRPRRPAHRRRSRVNAPVERRVALAAGLEHTHRRIQAAAQAAGRDPAGVRLVVVTKTFPASDVRLLAGLGVRDVGENRDQEAAPKAADLSDLDLSWHFVGSAAVQQGRPRSRRTPRSSSRSTGPRWSAPLATGADRAGRELGVLIQVSLDGDPAAAGWRSVRPRRMTGCSLWRLRSRTGARPGRCGASMAVAPLGADPATAFARLAGWPGPCAGTTPERPGSRPG